MDKAKLAALAGLSLAMSFVVSSCAKDEDGAVCNGREYDGSLYRCEQGELIGKCMGQDYYIDYQICDGGIIQDMENPSRGGSSSSGYDAASYCAENPDKCFLDKRDGQLYRFATVNNRGWGWTGFGKKSDGLVSNRVIVSYAIMIDHLNYSRDNTLGYCYGVDVKASNPHKDSTTCDNGYGRVYEWEVAMNGNSSQGLCPDEWHVPSYEEWLVVSMESYNSNQIRSILDSNFAILPGNYNTNPEYPPLGWKERDESGFAWASNSDMAYVWSGYGNPPLPAVTAASKMDDAPVQGYFSVRCIKDFMVEPD